MKTPESQQKETKVTKKEPFPRCIFRGGTKSVSKSAFFGYPRRVLDLTPFQNLQLRGGFILTEVHLTARPLLDPLERAATAQTIIRGTRLHIFVRADLDERELSISLYHEVLEAATVASDRPPEQVMEFNEGHFEHAAQSAHARLGIASPAALNQMLADFGF